LEESPTSDAFSVAKSWVTGSSSNSTLAVLVEGSVIDARLLAWLPQLEQKALALGHTKDYRLQNNTENHGGKGLCLRKDVFLGKRSGASFRQSGASEEVFRKLESRHGQTRVRRWVQLRQVESQRRRIAGIKWLACFDTFDYWRSGLAQYAISAERAFDFRCHCQLIGSEMLTAAYALVHYSCGALFCCLRHSRNQALRAFDCN
jgi:hypothetical protein